MCHKQPWDTIKLYHGAETPYTRGLMDYESCTEQAKIGRPDSMSLFLSE